MQNVNFCRVLVQYIASHVVSLLLGYLPVNLLQHHHLNHYHHLHNHLLHRNHHLIHQL